MYDLLTVELRDPHGGPGLNKLRKQGAIPGVLLSKGMESIPVQFTRDNFRKILAQGVKVFEVAVEDGEKYLVNMDELQRDPVDHKVLHVSFHKLNKNQSTHVLVPIKLEGSAVGAKEGGVARQLMNEVMITGLPHKIPEVIVVNVDSLDVGDHLSIQDIKLDGGLSFDEADLEKSVVNCAIPKVVEESPVETEVAAAEGAVEEGAVEADGKDGGSSESEKEAA